ncbi:hypothetical protein [Streptomyces sp. SM13]|uniref:hypothetical protein n=1 Tax=Streptomyces sp. SM13 TaxID=1983803 RepID=UPI0015E19DB1|nr:hypothetical protein [Streptomyces sp. SM13]
MSTAQEEGIAARVGAGIGEGPFRCASAWAWMWRSFDLSLPDVSGAVAQTDPVASQVREPPTPSAREQRAAVSRGYGRHAAHGPW